MASYGFLPVTNSPASQRALGGRALLGRDASEIVELGLQSRYMHDDAREVQEYVRRFHTYHNRVESLLRVLVDDPR